MSLACEVDSARTHNHKKTQRMAEAAHEAWVGNIAHAGFEFRRTDQPKLNGKETALPSPSPKGKAPLLIGAKGGLISTCPQAAMFKSFRKT